MPRATTGPEIDRPTPPGNDPSEADAVLRLRALMWADWNGWIEFWGPVDADVVDPSNLTYAYVLPETDTDAPDFAGPLTWTAAEVLPIVYAYGLAVGDPGPVAYRKGLPR